MAGVTIREDRIEVSGDLNVESAASVFRQRIQFNPTRNRVDLAEVDACDSSGLALLVHWYALAEKAEVDIEFVNVPQKLLEIADLAGLGGIFAAPGSK